MENLDHVYCNTTTVSNTDIQNNNPDLITNVYKEIKQLQSMLILHLDLIQEQSDQILAKDKLLLKLKTENEMLKLRLDRVDRRIFHSKQPKEKDINLNIGSNIEYYNKSNDFYDNFVVPANTKNDENDNKNGTIINKIVLQRIQGANRNIMAIKKEIESTEYDNYDFLMDESCKTIKTEEEDDSKFVKVEGGENVFDENVIVESPPADVVMTDINEEEEELVEKQKVVEDEFKFEGNNAKCAKPMPTDMVDISTFKPAFNTNSNFSSSNSSDTGNEKKNYKNPFMITNKPYITCNWKDEIINEDIEKLLINEAAELEIPCWTVVEDSCSSEILEPTTEIVTDEVYFKRHAKLEQDERRRKKWDVQRIREQKTIERLKKRHLKELFVVENTEPKMISSFYPCSDSIKFIQITDEIPVQAFGESIPLLTPGYFHLPWSHISANITPNSSSSTEAEVKTVFMHRLAPALATPKQKFTKRVRKDN